MAATKEGRVIVPEFFDEKQFLRSYQSAVAKRQKRFKEDVARSALVNKLKTEALREAAKAAGAKLSPLTKPIIAGARSVIAQLRQQIPRSNPPRKGADPVPFGAPLPPLISGIGPNIEFVPWAGSPNPATGQVGSILIAWGAGSATVTYDLGSSVFLAKPGKYRVTVSATVNGIYYLYSPGPYQLAMASLGLTAWAQGPAAGYDPFNTTTVFGEALFYGGRDWNYINGQYNATLEFIAGDAPTMYLIGAGTTQTVFATAGCIAGIDAYTTIQSINVDYYAPLDPPH